MTEDLSKSQRWGRIKARFWSVMGSLFAFCLLLYLHLGRFGSAAFFP